MFDSRFLTNLKRLRALMRELQLESVHIVVPSLLALLASIFEGASLGLLAPTARGLMEGNFKFAANLPVLKNLIHAFPQIFSSGQGAIFLLLAALIFLSVVVKSILFYFSALLITQQVRRLSDDLRKLLFNSYIHFQKSFFDKTSTGHLQNILIGYTEQIALQFKNVNQALYLGACVFVYLTLMFFISWKVALFSMVCFPVLVVVFNRLITKIRRDSQVFAQLFTEMGKKITNSLLCIPLVKAASTEAREKEWFAFTSRKVRKIQFDMDRRALLIQPAQEIFIITLTMILLGFMAYLIVHTKEGHLSGYLVFFLLLRRMLSAVGQLTNLRGQLASIIGPLGEVVRVFENRTVYSEKTGILPLVVFKDQIEFKNLSFGYGEREILKNFCLQIKKGKMTAIIGKTGSGKSTIAQILMRFYDPPRGTVFIDGQDILDYQIGAIRKKIGYVSQDLILFDATIEMNLKYVAGRPVTDEEVLSAIEKAQLQDLINRLPQGLQTEVGERGVQLSGGEKQRLSIARAFLRNPEIIILDEATSGLDSHTEELIQKAVAELVRNRTAIVIAHRLNTIKQADYVVELGSQIIS